MAEYIHTYIICIWEQVKGAIFELCKFWIVIHSCKQRLHSSCRYDADGHVQPLAVWAPMSAARITITIANNNNPLAQAIINLLAT